MWKSMLFALAIANTAIAADDEVVDQDFDREIAIRVLQSIGADIEGSSFRCTGCHDPNLVVIKNWATASLYVNYSCLHVDEDSDEEQPDALSRVNCLREDPEDEDSKFSASKLGLLTAGAHLPFFKDLFIEAYGAAEGEDKHANFVSQVGMPKNSNLMNAESFDELVAWATHSDQQPYLEELVGRPADAPRSCEPWRNDEFDAYLASRAADNWAHRNREAGIEMFACPDSNMDALACFKDKEGDDDKFPELSSTAWGKEWSKSFDQAMRLLIELDYRTSFWMRSSADGRFIGNGRGSTEEEGFGGVVTDLWAGVYSNGSVRTDIFVDASFDPSFFPDNSGFMFQGEGGYCDHDVLLDPDIAVVNFDEEGCVKGTSVPLYQGVGASLDGTDYYAVTGAFTGDSGPSQVGSPDWLVKSYLNVSRIIHNGRSFEAMKPVTLWTPYLGDFGLSPSTDLTVSRVSGLDDDDEFKHMGYEISRLRSQKDGMGNLEVELEPMLRLCEDGAKANFSFDDRFLVTHRTVREGDYEEFGYGSASDEAFQALVGSNNVYLFDLKNGNSYRVTTVGPMQHAKFPHFRSDGWMYFLALEDNNSYVVASDIALRLSEE